MNLWRKSPKFIISVPECCGRNGPVIFSSTFSKYAFGIIKRVNHIGGLIILSYLRSDQSLLYKLKKPTTRWVHSFQSNRFNSTIIGSMAAHQRKDKDGHGWDHEDNSEEEYAPIGSQPITLFI
ncbi:hypothetical protein B9Z55_028616 [Caenorhabditis nigoni]|uniref:Uncharacterized protein n=1 Tax=Caenorhabditis nigoni TaxID=1611254 RepID=A0A2G5SB66_9PELO|nr:hypothetical protein B9Z55_028616 [Caenorhabditis nigoni]